MDGAELTTGAIRAAFDEEIAGLGGCVEGFVEDGGEAFARSRLPWTREVGRRDRVFGGVALCAGPEALCVRPYIFRVVCRNGAVMARAMEAATIGRGGAPDEVEAELRGAIRGCGSEAAFEEGAARMEHARDVRADMELTLVLSLARHRWASRWMGEILRRFVRGDRSAFGLLNAVTSVARERRVARERWDLEELGGELAYLCAEPKARPRRAARVMAGA